jgi:hypothetical protein
LLLKIACWDTAHIAVAPLSGTDARMHFRSYFFVPQAPLKEPVLVLNGEGHGIVNSLCVISAVTPTYASPGAALLSVIVLGIPVFNDQELETAA